METKPKFVFVPIYLDPVSRSVNVPYGVVGEFVGMGHLIGMVMESGGTLYYTGCTEHFTPGAIVYTTSGPNLVKAYRSAVVAGRYCSVQEIYVPLLKAELATREIGARIKTAYISRRVANALARKILDEFRRIGVTTSEWEEEDVDETPDEYISDWLVQSCRYYYYL